MILPNLVTFDWDGTLAETRSCVVGALEIVLANFNKEPWEITKTKYRDTNKSLKENFPNFFGQESVKAYDLYLTHYRELMPSRLTAIEGSHSLIKLLINRGIKFGIISNKETSLLLTEIETLFPTYQFNFAIGDGDAEYNKPHPAPIYQACKKIDIAPSVKRVWHVGDSKQDTDCAINANVTPVLIGKGKFFDEGNSIEQTIKRYETMKGFAREFK